MVGIQNILYKIHARKPTNWQSVSVSVSVSVAVGCPLGLTSLHSLPILTLSSFLPSSQSQFQNRGVPPKKILLNFTGPPIFSGKQQICSHACPLLPAHSSIFFCKPYLHSTPPPPPFFPKQKQQPQGKARQKQRKLQSDNTFFPPPLKKSRRAAERGGAQPLSDSLRDRDGEVLIPKAKGMRHAPTAKKKKTAR